MRISRIPFLFFLTLIAPRHDAVALDMSLPRSFADPWGSDALTAPDPATPWQSPTPLASVPAPAPVQTGKLDQPLNLVQLTDMALRNNPTTRVAWLAARASAAGVGLARANYLPQIDGQFATNVSRGASTSGFATPEQVRYGPGVTLTYLLLDFGTRAGQLQAAQYNLLAANLNQNQALQDVMLQVEQNYFQALGFQALASANQQSLQSADLNLQAATHRLKAGLATVGDVYQAQTAQAQARLALQRAQGQLAGSMGQLATSVGLPVGTPLKLTPWSQSAMPAFEKSVDELLREAQAYRPSLLAMDARAKAAQSQVRIAAGQGRPSLTLNGGSSYTHIVGRGSIPQYNIGATLRIPIFTGFRTTYAIRQARAQAEEAVAQRDQSYQAVELEVWQAYYNHKTAADTLANSETLLRSAVLAAQVAQARYHSGLGTILELLTTQASEANARVQRIQAQLDWYASLAQLGHAVGTLQSAGNLP